MNENTSDSKMGAKMSEAILSQQTGEAWRIKGLAADGPLPELKEKLMLFGQFVGDWDSEARYPRPDGTEARTRGEIHVRWILEGRALQDTFMSKDDHTGRAIPAGTTLRYYDPTIDSWHSIWFSPRQGVIQRFLARQEGNEIVLRGSTRDGYPEHWIFSKITPVSFHWRSIESHDQEKTWLLTEEIIAHRLQPKDGLEEMTGKNPNKRSEH